MNIIEKEKQLAEYDGADKVISSAEFSDILDKQPQVHQWQCGMLKLDALHQGFEAGELILLAGPSKNGKTTMARTLTYNFAKQKIGVLWFTFEETERQFFSKFTDLPLFYLPQAKSSHMMSWIEDRIIESKLKYDSRIVFIDNFDFLETDISYREKREASGHIVSELKRIAIEQNIVIFLLMHVLKDKQKFMHGEISASDIRGESSKPMCLSDTSLIIWRNKFMDKNELDNTATLKICLTRRSGIAEEKIPLKLVDGFFVEMTEASLSTDRVNNFFDDTKKY